MGFTGERNGNLWGNLATVLPFPPVPDDRPVPGTEIGEAHVAVRRLDGVALGRIHRRPHPQPDAFFPPI